MTDELEGRTYTAVASRSQALHRLISGAPRALGETAGTALRESASVSPEGNGHSSANALCGYPIVDSRGEDVGRVADLLLDSRTGRICCVEIASDGLLGIDESRRVVAWSDLTLDVERSRFVLAGDA